MSVCLSPPSNGVKKPPSHTFVHEQVDQSISQTPHNEEELCEEIEVAGDLVTDVFEDDLQDVGQEKREHERVHDPEGNEEQFLH